MINATLSKRNVLALIPTGGGKSLTFQISAISDPGVTFVIMPLLSLIEDNLSFVQELGIPAISLDANSIANDYHEIQNCKYKLVYTTPEKLITSQVYTILCNMAAKGMVERFVIDEVHCVSHWG